MNVYSFNTCITIPPRYIGRIALPGWHGNNHFMTSCMVFLLISDTVGSDQREPTLQQPKRHCGRCPASVVCICLAVLIASVGVVVCLLDLPWPFANDWKDQMCPAIPLPWLWRHGGMYTGICWHA